VALGTPVLVFAALHWILQAIWRRTWLKFTDRDIEGKNSDEIDEEEGSIEEEDRRDLDCEEKKEIYRWTSRAYASPLIVGGKKSIDMKQTNDRTTTNGTAYNAY
jgi:hypothetical protein